jgi:hypothetical protein
MIAYAFTGSLAAGASLKLYYTTTMAGEAVATNIFVTASNCPSLPACATAYSQGNCLSYALGAVISSGGHNWLCANNNCRDCSSYASCGPGATGCPWGVVWTDQGTCQ